uniref:Uncharacterized protein n=1 Tax=Kalanchoe fedtschenkoi TaxID=63787 RepID=A0A7N0RIU8_KALFE
MTTKDVVLMAEKALGLALRRSKADDRRLFGSRFLNRILIEPAIVFLPANLGAERFVPDAFIIFSSARVFFSVDFYPSTNVFFTLVLVVPAKVSRGRQGPLPPPSGAKAVTSQKPNHLDLGDKLLSLRSELAMRRSRSEGTLSAL